MGGTTCKTEKDYNDDRDFLQQDGNKYKAAAGKVLMRRRIETVPAPTPNPTTGPAPPTPTCTPPVSPHAALPVLDPSVWTTHHFGCQSHPVWATCPGCNVNLVFK